MGVSNGQVANETTFNNAFMARNNDTDTTGKVDLKNSGSTNVLDVQKMVNQIMDTDGIASLDDANRKVYSDTTVVANADDRKVAIGKLSAAFKESGSPLAITRILTQSDGENFRGLATFISGTMIGVVGNGIAQTVTINYSGKPKTYINSSITMADNTSSATVLAAVTQAANLGFEANFSIKRGTNWIIGKIRVVDNGDSTASITPNYVEVGDCGITWTATIESLVGVASICLKYTTTSTGTAAKAQWEYDTYPIPT